MSTAILSRLAARAASSSRACARPLGGVTHFSTDSGDDAPKKRPHGRQLQRRMTRRSQDATELFDMLDHDDDGVVSREVFADSMRSLGVENLAVLQRSLARSELSKTSAAEAAVDVPFDDESAKKPGIAELLSSRFGITFEVMVSKIFPAGFGWQLSSVIAEENFGFAADSAQFALTTGAGDGIGVLIGHTAYYMVKKATVDPTIDALAQLNTGILLGSAAFCSGTVWQPTVDAFTKLGCSFTGAAVGTTVVCGLAFYTGLRLGRGFYANTVGLHGVEESNYGNLKADAMLSVAIGGATGAFVGTDVSFGDTNWLRPYVGIEDGTALLMGCSTAGASTALGFAVFQTVENVVVSPGKNWVD